jgi:hypothetical protein
MGFMRMRPQAARYSTLLAAEQCSALRENRHEKPVLSVFASVLSVFFGILEKVSPGRSRIAGSTTEWQMTFGILTIGL